MGRRRTKRKKTYVELQREWERIFLEDGTWEKIGKLMVDLKIALNEDEKLRKELQGAPLRVWANLVIAALGLNPRSRPTVEDILRRRYVGVDEERRAWANKSSWFQRT